MGSTPTKKKTRDGPHAMELETLSCCSFSPLPTQSSLNISARKKKNINHTMSSKVHLLDLGVADAVSFSIIYKKCWCFI
jgi:hypothetical protein